MEYSGRDNRPSDESGLNRNLIMLWRSWLSKLPIRRRRRADEELEEEIAAHLVLEARLRIESGDSPEQAEKAARRQFGNLGLIKENTRAMWGSGILERFFKDLKYAFKALGKAPGFAAVAVLTLALGIGANTAIFSVDYATLLAPLPYPDPQSLVMVWSKLHGNRVTVSAGDFLEWKRQSRAFQDLNAWTSRSFNLATGNRAEVVEGRAVTPGLYRMLGVSFSLGRGFLPEEGNRRNDHVVILTNKFWQKLGSNSDIIGSGLRIDGETYTIVGVFAPGLTDRGQGDLAIPLAFSPADINHESHWLTVMGRLQPGTNLPQAQADMKLVTTHLAEAYPESDRGWSASVEPLKNDFIPAERIRTLWLLLGAVGFVLLIACVNIANLLLARGLARQKEMAVRSALGAKPAALFVQLLIESLLLAVAGGIFGIALGYAMLRGFVNITPANTLPSEADIRLNLPILLFTLVLTTLAGVLFGCAPAWFASRTNAAEALKDGQRTGISAGRRRLNRLLVAGEFALALTLLSGAGLAIHSFWKLLHVDLGIRTDDAFTFDLSVPDSRPKDPEHVEAYCRRILAKIASIPGVRYVSAETGTPMEGAGFNTPFTIAGQSVVLDLSQRPVAGLGMVTPEFFKTFGIQLLRGRFFTERDTRSSRRVAVVNESFVRKFLKGTDPLEHQVMVPRLDARFAPGVPVPFQIVGVIPNIPSRGLRQDVPEIYIPFWQSPWPSVSIGVRTAGKAASTRSSIEDRIHALDPDVAVAYPRTMAQVRDEVLANDHFTAILFGSFAAVALLLATVGIYGVMAFAATQRSQEVALRVALGATQRIVIFLIMREGMVLAVIGISVGLIGSYFVDQAMRSALFGINSLDFGALAAVGLTLLIAACVASYVPARRAALSDPIQLLRLE